MHSGSARIHHPPPLSTLFDPRPLPGDSHNSTPAERHSSPALVFLCVYEFPGVGVSGLAVSFFTSEPSFSPRNVLYGPVTTSVPSFSPESTSISVAPVIPVFTGTNLARILP